MTALKRKIIADYKAEEAAKERNPTPDTTKRDLGSTSPGGINPLTTEGVAN